MSLKNVVTMMLYPSRGLCWNIGDLPCSEGLKGDKLPFEPKDWSRFDAIYRDLQVTMVVFQGRSEAVAPGQELSLKACPMS